MKKIVIESHIPAVPADLNRYFDIVRLDPEAIDAAAVRDAAGLIVRTRTRCDAALLEGSAVEFVATATIGTDHIDLPYCASRGIEAVSAPGCNAPAVAQYVMASLLTLFPEGIAGKRIAVIGVGHVGSIVERWARALGAVTLLVDPPRALAEGPEAFSTLEDAVREADIVTLHVPHTRQGAYATHHMADSRFYELVKPGVTLINSARGPITDTPALVDAIKRGTVAHAVIDCWENEPDIDRELLSLADIATPHIAGYSLNGKIRATAASVNAFARHFGVNYRYDLGDIPAAAPDTVTAAAIKASYTPLTDTAALRSDPAAFERLRNRYPLRPEVAGNI